jgi:ubiquinone/menaquinone biosynthesis C-methylase UbiE
MMRRSRRCELRSLDSMIHGTSSAEYHLQELALALDPAAAAHRLPVIGATDQAILDIGCGAGQTLIAARLGRERTAVGLDVDHDALALGRTLTDAVEFVAGRAETLPFGAGRFDLVVSRVALPYADIPRATAEMARVLRPGGRCWLLLHPPSFAWRALVEAVMHGRVRIVPYQLYVLVNGLALELFGRQFAYPLKRARFESVQTSRGMRRVLEQAGFEGIAIDRGKLFAVVAVRRP